MKTETIKIEKLKPHPRNYNAHPEEQLKHIIKSIEQHGVYRPVIVAKDLTILAGHGLVEALKRMGKTEISIYKLNISPDDPQALKVLVGDNEISNLGNKDEDMLAGILGSILEVEKDVEALMGTGYSEDLLKEMIENNESASEESSPYTTKIVSPIYTPKEEKPTSFDLVDRTKTEELVTEILKSDAPWEVKEFLKVAAERHTVFNFRKIADFYAHSDKEVQQLFEKSALVIIDFKQAIENGYVNITKEIGGLAKTELAAKEAAKVAGATDEE